MPTPVEASIGPVARPYAAFRWIALGLVVIVGVALRLAYYDGPHAHPDEPITFEVVGHMRQSGDWDTNWANVAKLDANYRYDQYNFSSYLYANFWFYRFVKVLPGTLAWRSEAGGFWVYRFLSVLLAALVLVPAWWIGRRLGGFAVGAGAVAFTSVSVLLVQDAHYARPEAFTTLLTLVAVVLCWPRARLSASAVLAGAGVIGLLIACKVSMLALAWLPLVPVLACWRDGGARRYGLIAATPLGLAAGFALGAPGAVAHPAAFLNGVKYLTNQYGGLHPPHSHMDGRPVADLLGGYFVGTLGWPLLIAGGIGLGVLAWRRRWAELALLGGPVVFFGAYFSTRSVFFERNLSHVLPLGLILAALGAVTLGRGIAARMRLQAWVPVGALLLGLAIPPARVTWSLLNEFSGANSRVRQEFLARVQAEHPGARLLDTALLGWDISRLAELFRTDTTPVLLRATDYNDEWSETVPPQLMQRFEMRLIAEDPSHFANIPVCTLHTYHSTRARYYLVTGLRGP